MSVPPNANTGPQGAGDTNGMQAIALDYVRRSWAVIPLHWIMDDGRCSCANGPNPCDGSAGKHPLRKNWTRGDRLSSADIYAIWNDDTPRANIGLRTGVISGFWVLDVDPKSGGFQSLQKLQAEVGVLPTTYVVKTPSGGYHYYFTMPDFSLRNGSNAELKRRFGPGLDIRGDGGQVVAVGSRTDQGAYTIQVDASIATAPEGLLALLRPQKNQADTETVVIEDLPATADLDFSEAQRVQNYADVTISRVIAEYRQAPPGTGNDTLFKSACSVIEFAQSPWNTHTISDVRQQLLDAARARRAAHPSGGGQSDAEFDQVWRSARNRTVGQGRALPVSPSEALAFDPFPGTGVGDPFAQPVLTTDTPADAPPVVPSVPVAEMPAAPIAPPAERAIATTQVAEPADVETPRNDHVLALLPAEFYDQRPWLKELRRVAYERMAAPDAVLGAWLALVSSQVPPGVRLDTTIGSGVTASLYVVLTAPSGIGKTIAASVARDIYPERIETELLATGEGIVEAFWGMKKVQDPDTLKFTNERAQIYTNKFFKMDEGQGLLQLEKRTANVTGAILRSMWSGDDAGQSNASPDRKRKVMAGSYNLGVVLGMQHEVAGEILADTSLGTPQRFLWFSTADPSVTSAYSDEPFTGTLAFASHADYVRMTPPVFLGGSTPDLDLTPMPMTMERSIIQQIRDTHADKVAGKITVDSHDSQKPVSVSKIAMLITYIDGSNHITEEVWNLANQVYDNSATVRDQIIEIAAEKQRDEKLALAHDKAREKQAIGRYGTEQVDTIRKIFEWIASGRNTRRAITQNAKGARRAVLADVLDQMVKAGHLREIDLGNRQIRYERSDEWTP